MTSERKLSEVLSEFARTMVTDFPIQGILDHLVGQIVAIMPIHAAGVTLISPGVRPQYIAASNEAALRFEELQTELGEGPCLDAYHTGEAVVIPDLRKVDRFPNFTPRAVEAGLRAVFTFPLRHGEHQLGALDLYRTTPGNLDAQTMVAAQTLADVAAAYLLNAQARADLEESSVRTREAALHDGLTGLANRMLLLERLEHAMQRSQRSGRQPAVLLVDLDRFKVVNDTYGRRVGDELLIEVADRLTGLLRAGDTVARLTGDEFVVLCEDLDSPRQAAAIAARVDAELAVPFVLSGTRVDMTASIGIAHAGDLPPEQVVHDAGRAMYRAKRQAVARRQVFDLRDEQLAGQHAGLELDLHGLLGRDELYLHYQPIVAAQDRRLTGVEALLRWLHRHLGAVPPSVLIPMAEQSGMMPEIGRWVLQKAWTDWHAWERDRRSGHLTLSVNVSVHQLMAEGFVETVAAVLSANPRRLILEVTEGVFVSDGQRALGVLKDLKALGVLLALDDFGTGYSSLSYLKRFPVDVVKIDQSFVSDLGRDPASRTIVASIIRLAHDLGMTVVAEGVETSDQHLELTGLGCDFCQGYYFAKPMSAANLVDLIQTHADGGNLLLPAPAAT